MEKEARATTVEAQAKAYLELCELDSHWALMPEGIKHLTEPFGFAPEKVASRVMANTGEFKGLTVEDVGPNTPVTVVQAWDLAEAVLTSLGGSPGPFNGRGTRFRYALEQIKRLLNEKGAELS